jgi:putative oxidoreductase
MFSQEQPSMGSALQQPAFVANGLVRFMHEQVGDGHTRCDASICGVAMPSWRCLFAVPPPRRGVEALLLLLARIVAGVMFCVSGWNKVFTDAGRERMVHTLVDAGIPFPVFSAPVLGAIEWIAGGLLVLGLLSRPRPCCWRRSA